MSQRIVCWFSCGAASAVATKLAIESNNASPEPKELVVASIFLKEEHPDSERFKRDCSTWFGQSIVDLRNDKYNASVDEVIDKTSYMSGVYGARCTKELKKQVRLDWQRDDDIHVFGMTVDEQSRIDGLIDTEPTLELWAPLIDKGLTKKDCFDTINRAGIELPKMYKLGYYNNNCVGCLKATGAGYWNKIRVDFPDVYAIRAEQERRLGVALVTMSKDKFKKQYPNVYEKMTLEGCDKTKTSVRKRKNGDKYDYITQMIPLRYLPSDAGHHKDLDIGNCGFFCESK